MSSTFTRLTSGPLAAVPARDKQAIAKDGEAKRKAYLATGPRTEEGKQKSSQNARKHGYAGANMVIADEDKAAYNAHLDAYALSFAPQTQAECDVIRRAANALWRSDRLTSIESGIFDLQLDYNQPAVELAFPIHELHHKLAYTFMEQTNTEGEAALALCHRYITAANRDFDRAIRTFYLMKENRISEEEKTQAEKAIAEEKEPEKAPTPNELPKPAPKSEIIPFPAPKSENAKAPQSPNREESDTL